MSTFTRTLTLGIATALSLSACDAGHLLPDVPGAGGSAETTAATTATTAAETTTTTASTTATTVPAEAGATRIDEAGAAASLGFNNAEQMVRTEDGVLHVVWVDGDALVHGAIDAQGGVTTSLVRDAAAISLPAIAVSGGTLAVAWTEGTSSVMAATSGNGGQAWSAPQPVGDGAGASLAGDDRGFVAAWHDGREGARPAIRLSLLDRGEVRWSEPRRVDASPAAPVWPAVAVDGDHVWVTWRDNRGGPYTIWLRHSVTRAATWHAEQQVVTTASGDPDICTAAGAVWIGYHGRGTVSVARSVNDGTTFPSVVEVGAGWFAHVSCGDDGGVAVAWEQTTGSVQDDGPKAAAYAFVAAGSELVSTGVVQEGEGLATSIARQEGSGAADVLWLDGSTSDEPLRGALWHQVVALG